MTKSNLISLAVCILLGGAVFFSILTYSPKPSWKQDIDRMNSLQDDFSHGFTQSSLSSQISEQTVWEFPISSAPQVMPSFSAPDIPEPVWLKDFVRPRKP